MSEDDGGEHLQKRAGGIERSRPRALVNFAHEPRYYLGINLKRKDNT